MFESKVLVCELLAIDGATTSSITPCEVPSLEHEAGYNPVEARALVSISLLASAQSAEVCSGLGDNVVEELEDYARSGAAIDREVKVNVLRRPS